MQPAFQTRVLYVLLLFFFLIPPAADRVLAETVSGESASDKNTAKEQEYHTPLAGEPFHTTLFGHPVDIPARSRDDVTSITLGAIGYIPNLASNSGLPVASLFLRRIFGDGWVRAQISGVINEVDLVKSFGRFEILGRFENNTIPFAEKGIRDNTEVKESSVTWGTLSTLLGAGLRFPVAPYQFDNEFRMQLYGRIGYLYSQPTDDTPPGVILPPDTMLLGVRLQVRYDGLRRNLLELPHYGHAAGFQLDYVHRNRWSDFGNAEVTFKKEDTQEYETLTAYWVGAFGIPGLSEKNRILGGIHIGISKANQMDRFNAFRFVTGPFAAETDEIPKPNYPGALYNELTASEYVLVDILYRRELLFFTFLHLRSSFIWANRGTVIASNQIGYKSRAGENLSAALTTGFFWKSQLFLQYAWDSGFLRDGKTGSIITLMLSKPF